MNVLYLGAVLQMHLFDVLEIGYFVLERLNKCIFFERSKGNAYYWDEVKRMHLICNSIYNHS